MGSMADENRTTIRHIHKPDRCHDCLQTFSECPGSRFLTEYLATRDLLDAWQQPPASSPATPVPQGNSNAARPPAGEEMETAVAAEAAPLSANPYTPDATHGTAMIEARTNINDANNVGAFFETSAVDRLSVDHFAASYTRESGEVRTMPSQDEDNALAAELLALQNGASAVHAGAGMDGADPGTSSSRALVKREPDEGFQEQEQDQGRGGAGGDALARVASPAPGAMFDGEPTPSTTQPADTHAYAMLSFQDGDYYITSFEVLLGRDMNMFKQQQREQKREKRDKQRAEERAQEALESYKKEPSQPSLHGDDDAQRNLSHSSESLDGRPAPPSTFSQQGGAVAISIGSDPEDEKLERRRSKAISKSSSTTSIAPAHLHTNTFVYENIPRGDAEEPAKVWIHPSNMEDIGKISKEHLRIAFSFEQELWELHILGSNAFVNGELYHRNAAVSLQHEDEIIVSTVRIVFKLPDDQVEPSPSQQSDSSGSDRQDSLRSSQSDRAGSATSEELPSDSEDDQVAPSGARKGLDKKPALKLKLKNAASGSTKRVDKAQKKQEKTKAKRRQSSTLSPEATKKPEKGKKPKAAAKEKEEKPKETRPTPAPPPIHIEPGSVLESIPEDQRPQKKTGAGRPPKNGMVSQRDTQLANKLRKEIEATGREAPHFNILVEEVRRRQKEKEQKAKTTTNGELPPEGTVMPSIEKDEGNQKVINPATASANVGESNGNVASDVLVKVESDQKQAEPKREFSPIKPESEFTEAELQKPQQTYVIILDEILRNCPNQTADLQEIYDKLQKKYPYYKYKFNGPGWQSSVRHNLGDSGRFVKTGNRSGKGNFWTINWNTPLEKESKRKGQDRAVGQPHQTRPPIPQQQWGAMQYGNPYAPNQPNGQQMYRPGPQPGPNGYYSPYGQAGQPGTQATNLANPTSQPQRSSSLSQQPPTSSHQTPSQTNNDQYGGLITSIMNFRNRYLEPYIPNQPAFELHQSMFSNMTVYVSDLYHYGSTKQPPPKDETEKRVCDDLTALFERYKDFLPTKPSETPTPAQSGDVGGENGKADVKQAVEHGVAGAALTSGQNAHAAAASDVNIQPLAAPTAVQASSTSSAAKHTLQGSTASSNEFQAQPTTAQGPLSMTGMKRTAPDESELPDAKRTMT